MGVLPGTRYAVVSRGYYEGGDYILANLVSGDTASVDQLPVLSPDRRHIVIASMDFEAGYHPNVLEVWQLGVGRPVRGFRMTTGEMDPPSGWAPSNPRWVGADTIVFTQNVLIEDEVGRYLELPARLVRTADGWALQTRGP